jgi:hypothetical protein
METKPKYNEFLKSWSSENKITSFFGSDKPEFLKDWNQAKMGKVAPAVKPVIEPVVEPKRTLKDLQVGDVLNTPSQYKSANVKGNDGYEKPFMTIIKITPKTVGVVLNTWTVKDNKRVPITIDPQDKPDRTIPISEILDFTKIENI